jgi:hypothetical protein
MEKEIYMVAISLIDGALNIWEKEKSPQKGERPPLLIKDMQAL